MGLATLEVTDTPTHFLWGPLALPPLLAAVTGLQPALVPARLPGLAAVTAPGDALPGLVPRPGAAVEGVLATLPPEAADRLAFHAAALGRSLSTLPAPAEGAAMTVTVPWLWPAPPPGATDWDPARWRDGDTLTEAAAAADILAARGKAPPETLARRRHAMLVRAASHVRAQSAPAPATLRHRAQPGDIAVQSRRQPYAAFFAVEEYDLTHRRFDGRMSDPIRRAVFISGDAVTVLPYDPVRDMVLLIEQVRAGPIGRGDPEPWQLEAIAGRIDPGETPEEAARREAEEEAGLALGRFLHVADYYPTPGAKAEWLASFVALTDLPEGIEGHGGKADEAEDIRSHRLPWARVADLLSSGEINNAPLLITLLWLQRERPGLRA